MANKRRTTKHTATTLFLAHVRSNNLHSVEKSIENGINVHSHNDLALQISMDKEYYDITVALLEKGTNGPRDDNYFLLRSIDRALICSIRLKYFKIALILLDKGASADCDNNYPLRQCVTYINAIHWSYFGTCIHDCGLSLMEKLLECGADVYWNNNYILTHMIIDEELAAIIFPYCSTNDYQYFSTEFITKNVVQTKSAKMV